MLRVQVHVARVQGQQHDAQCEQSGESDADRRVFLGPALAGQLHQERGDEPHDGRADEHRERPEAVRQQERQHKTEQHRVADGVADHGHAPQDEKAADKPAAGGDQGRVSMTQKSSIIKAITLRVGRTGGGRRSRHNGCTDGGTPDGPYTSLSLRSSFSTTSAGRKCRCRPRPIDVVHGEVRLVHQKQLPKAVPANDLLGFGHALGG